MKSRAFCWCWVWKHDLQILTFRNFFRNMHNQRLTQIFWFGHCPEKNGIVIEIWCSVMLKKLRTMPYPIENLHIIWSIHTFSRFKSFESKIKVSTFSDSIRQSSLVVPEIFFFVKQTFQSNSKFVVRKIRASLYEQGSDWNYQGIEI